MQQEAVVKKAVNEVPRTVCRMKNAKDATEILLRYPDRRIRVEPYEGPERRKKHAICTCCLKDGTDECQHPEGEHVYIYICSGYILDEKDPAKTEMRALAFLQGARVLGVI